MCQSTSLYKLISLSNCAHTHTHTHTHTPRLKYLIVRPAIVYGVGDKNGLSKFYKLPSLTWIFYILPLPHTHTHTHTAPRLVTAACYRQLQEKMKLLWTEDLRMNTVHVVDVVRGLWLLGTTGGDKGEIYNMADKGETSKCLIVRARCMTRCLVLVCDNY